MPICLEYLHGNSCFERKSKHLWHDWTWQVNRTDLSFFFSGLEFSSHPGPLQFFFSAAKLRCWQKGEAQIALLPRSLRPGSSHDWRSLCDTWCQTRLLVIRPSTFAKWWQCQQFVSSHPTEAHKLQGRMHGITTVWAWGTLASKIPCVASLAPGNGRTEGTTFDESSTDQRGTHFGCSAQRQICRTGVASESLWIMSTEESAQKVGDHTTDSAFLADAGFCDQDVARWNHESPLATSSPLAQLRWSLCE